MVEPAREGEREREERERETGPRLSQRPCLSQRSHPEAEEHMENLLVDSLGARFI